MKRLFVVTLILMLTLCFSFSAHALINPANHGIPGNLPFPFKTGISTYAGTCEGNGVTCDHQSDAIFDEWINPAYTDVFPMESMAVVIRSASIQTGSDFNMPAAMLAKEDSFIPHDLMFPAQVALFSPANNGYIVYCFISTMVPPQYTVSVAGLFHNDACDYILERMGELDFLVMTPEEIEAHAEAFANQYAMEQNLMEPPLPPVCSPDCQQLLDQLYLLIDCSSPTDLDAYAQGIDALVLQADMMLWDEMDRQIFKMAANIALASGYNWASVNYGGLSGYFHLWGPGYDEFNPPSCLDPVLDFEFTTEGLWDFCKDVWKSVKKTDWKEVGKKDVKSGIRGLLFGSPVKKAAIGSGANVVKQVIKNY